MEHLHALRDMHPFRHLNSVCILMIHMHQCPQAKIKLHQIHFWLAVRAYTCHGHQTDALISGAD